MPETKEIYLALLRGINVGGANIVPMSALRASFEALGFDDVLTYIQSGNVVFRARRGDPGKLAVRIEKALSSEFGYTATVVLRSHAQMRRVVADAPPGFGEAPAVYASSVIFLKDAIASALMPSIKTREGVDQAHAGDGVIYFSRLISRASQSQMSRLISLPAYKAMTIRNWNTTTRLLRLMDAKARG
jgi:uncharacterized protein (DUF1697 family)